MGASDIEFSAAGNAAGIIKEFKKTQREVDKLEKKLGKTARTSKKAAKAGKEMTKSYSGVNVPIKKIVGALGVGGLVHRGLREILDTSEKWYQHMKNIAKQIKTAGQDMVAFALMQEGGQKRARVLETASIGAKYGVGMGQAWATVQALQSQTESYAGGKAAAIRSWQLMQMGVPGEAAAKAVSSGMGVGLTAGQAARLPYAAGEASSLSAAEISQGFPKAMPFYGDIRGGAIMGGSVMAHLSQIYKEPGELGTLGSRLAMGLKRTQVWKGRRDKHGRVIDPGLGYTGQLGDVFAQLEFLKSKGLTTDLALQEAGFGEIRERAAITSMFKGGGVAKFRKTYSGIQRMTETEGLLTRKRGAAEAELPEMKFARLLSKAKEQYSLRETFGPEARKSTITRLEDIAVGRWLQLAGAGRHVNPETLQPTAGTIGRYSYKVAGGFQGMPKATMRSIMSAYHSNIQQRGLVPEGSYRIKSSVGTMLPTELVGNEQYNTEAMMVERLYALLDAMNQVSEKQLSELEKLNAAKNNPRASMTRRHPGNE